MDFSYEKYYIDQAGSGFGVYHGYPYQKGRGFMSFLRNNVVPFFHYIGKKTIDKGLNILRDIDSENNIKEQVLNKTKQAARDITKDIIMEGIPILQSGEGIKRRKRSIKRNVKRKKIIKRKVIRKKVIPKKVIKRKNRRKRTSKRRYKFL